MTRTFGLVIFLAAIICSAGCKKQPAVCTVTQYGTRNMTYAGPREQFDEACRDVLRALSYKEKMDENRVRYPYYGEGASTNKDGDRSIALEAYMKTKDIDGAEYKITTLVLGERDPVVILESTSSDPHKLVNTLLAELHKRGIRVVQY